MINGENDFFDAQLASKTISVPYSNAALTVYQHKLDLNRYYVAPVGIFQVNTIKIERHPLTKVYGVKFSIVLTNSHIRNTVLQYLALKLSNCASAKSACTVELVPTDRVRLHWSTDTKIDPEFSIDKTWHTNTNLQDYVQFIIGCTTESSCQQLYNDIERAPETFVNGLRLEYMTTGAEMPSRTIQLSVSQVRSNSRYATYRQLGEQNASANNGQIYINTHDKNELLTSIARDSLAQQTEDEGYQADDADLQTDLVKLLSDMLISERVTLNSHMDQAWKSLYWHENNQRPDETVKTLEKILADLKTKNHTKSCNTTRILAEDDSGRGVSVNVPKQLLEKLPKIGPIIGLLASDDKDQDEDITIKKKKKKKEKTKIEKNDNDDDADDSERRRRKRFLFGYHDEDHHKMDKKTNYCPDDLLKTFSKNEKYIQWSGTSFKVKPMTVYRLNVGNYSDVASMTIKKVKVKLRKNIHSIALRSSTTITVNASSNDLAPSAFGTLWIAANLTELQRQFEEWKLKLQNELLSKYNELSVKYDKQNQTLLAAFNETITGFIASSKTASNRTEYLSNTAWQINSSIHEINKTLTHVVKVQKSTVIKLNCWRRAKYEIKHVSQYCDHL